MEAQAYAAVSATIVSAEPPVTDRRPLWTPEQVARWFRVDPHTVRRWVANDPAIRHRLGAIKTPGGRWRFDPDAVEREVDRLTEL
jgi:hypothetical protein